jgi:dienelactone hydrolase
VGGFLGRCFASAALLSLGLLSPAPAAAGELVSFGASAGAGPIAIQGYLTRPPGRGPFPAVVLLHSCLGLPSNRRSIGRELANWGYVALFVDDFATRGLRETCAVDFPEGLADAAGALAYMAKQPFVDGTRIAAIGYSQGGDTALQIAAGDLGFKAAIAFYPPCEGRLGVRFTIPTLILVGAADSVTPARYCEELAHGQPEARLLVYPGAGHVFDDPQFAGGRKVLGMWLQYDADAAAKSQAALHDFLATELAQRK